MFFDVNRQLNGSYSPTQAPKRHLRHPRVPETRRGSILSDNRHRMILPIVDVGCYVPPEACTLWTILNGGFGSEILEAGSGQRHAYRPNDDAFTTHHLITCTT